MAAPTKKVAPRPVNPDLIPADSGVETWRNVTAGTVYISRLGEYGRRFSEIVHSHRSFSVTPQERRMNQNACAIPELDVFTNGTLEPVNLLDDEPDTEKLRNNPNMISDRDLRLLFRLKGEVFNQRIGEVTNGAAINRLVEAARDPRHEATLAQYEALRLRKLEIDGANESDAPEPSDPNTAGLPRAVTPR